MAAALAFLGSFCFFQFAYPYHLMRREQLNLFLFDGDYIAGTYRGTGWLVRFVADFLEQFFHLPVAGPLIVALILTAIGWAGGRRSLSASCFSPGRSCGRWETCIRPVTRWSSWVS